ncbi:hypothetical protein [Burkholderia lata]|uniref:Uncharacterized protein n=1 Tax=Burkholderia lata (strain ATCC 17760 / DSM 23089 / LMG 22485 / NCIMB 9086 / R18194 / 383) TaxID=482957 RepID=A0A6P2GUX7_BURL3|nr:hypothetical protein [Burkholderia lata]VWB07598.1 hypothetical protein BLA6863_00176 [Burkholderia lata]
MSDPQAISGTRRAIKEMADGTIRVQIDIDPRFRSTFWALFPNIDMPVALAPLEANFEHKPSTSATDDHGKHYAMLYKSGWWHNPKVRAALCPSTSISPDERIEAIKHEIYGVFDVDSLSKISPEAFIQWCDEIDIRATLPAAFGDEA